MKIPPCTKNAPRTGTTRTGLRKEDVGTGAVITSLPSKSDCGCQTQKIEILSVPHSQARSAMLAQLGHFVIVATIAPLCSSEGTGEN